MFFVPKNCCYNHKDSPRLIPLLLTHSQSVHTEYHFGTLCTVLSTTVHCDDLHYNLTIQEMMSSLLSLVSLMLSSSCEFLSGFSQPLLPPACSLVRYIEISVKLFCDIMYC